VTWHSTAPFDVVALRTRRLAKARLRVATERAGVAAQNTEPTGRSPWPRSRTGARKTAPVDHPSGWAFWLRQAPW